MTNKITTVVFDLDNTLIDTERIKNHLDRASTEQGLSREEAIVIYQSSRDQAGKVIFDLDIYLRNLKERLKVIGREFNQEMYDEAIRLMQNDPELLLTGTRELLELSAEQGLRIVILSLGVRKWQEQKIGFSGLGRVIGNIEDRYKIKVERKYTADENCLDRGMSLGTLSGGQDGATEEMATGKKRAMRDIMGSSFSGMETVLFNDKPDETEELLRIFPHLQAYVRRAIGDVRYKEQDFALLAERFAGRVECSQSLLYLKELFAEKLIKEYEPRESDHR